VDAESRLHRAGLDVDRIADLHLSGQLQAADRSFELQPHPKVAGLDRAVGDAVERDVGVTPVGGEENRAEQFGAVLDREDARGGVVVAIVQKADAHRRRAGGGVPIRHERPALVPEIAAVDRADREIRMQVRPPDHVVLALRIQNERLDLFAGLGQ